ncbi:MAG: transposase [Deltaproteobacteria bacterium]|nr:transposase [Deltaproteobacteria bacterium]
MARKPRQHVPGGTYHVILRGNDSRPIFFRKEDRELFYHLIHRGKERYGHRVLAFCCMDTHVHLAVQVRTVSLSRIIHHLAGQYASRLHRDLGRKGHLFHNRFRAFYVDTESYFLELVRYIHLNPVRAGLVGDPGDFPWSGHRTILGLEHLPWVSTKELLAHFSPVRWRGRLLYEQFIREGIDKESPIDLSRLPPNEDREDLVISDTSPLPDTPTAPELDRILEIVCREFELPESRLRSRSQDSRRIRAHGWIGLLARDLGSATLNQVAARIGRDPSSVSRSVCRLEDRLPQSASTQRTRHRLLNNLGLRDNLKHR